MGIGAGEPRPGTEVLVLLPAVDDRVGGLAAEGFEDAAAAEPLRVLARRPVVGDPPMIEGKAGGARLPHERQELVQPPVLKAPDPRIHGVIAFSPALRPFHPGGILLEGEGRISVGDEPQRLRRAVVEKGLDRRRDGIDLRIPLVPADLLAEAEPQEVLPAPGIGVLGERRDGAVGRGEEGVRRAELGRPVQDPFVFGGPVRRRDVDLVVVLAPRDVDADGAGRPPQEKRADTIRQGIDFGDVDKRGFGEQPEILRHELPFGNRLRWEFRAREVLDPEAEPVGRERSVLPFPVHIRRVGGADLVAGPAPDEERVLEEKERAPGRAGGGGGSGGRRGGRGGRLGREAEQRPERAFMERQLVRRGRGDLCGERLDGIDMVGGAARRREDDLLGDEPPAGLELVDEVHVPAVRGGGEGQPAGLHLELDVFQVLGGETSAVYDHGPGVAADSEPGAGREILEGGEAPIAELRLEKAVFENERRLTERRDGDGSQDEHKRDRP